MIDTSVSPGVRTRSCSCEYVDVAEAIREPLSPAGQQLAAGLDDAVEGGVIGDVLFGNWKSE